MGCLDELRTILVSNISMTSYMCTAGKLVGVLEAECNMPPLRIFSMLAVTKGSFMNV